MVDRVGVGARIEAIVEYLGVEKSVAVSGKSAKQLLRYCAGAEITWGAALALVRESETTLSWLSTGHPDSDADFHLLVNFCRKQAGRSLKTGTSAASRRG